MNTTEEDNKDHQDGDDNEIYKEENRSLESKAQGSGFNHDSFLKKALEDPVIAQSFFTQHLPNNVKDIANLSTLKLEKESFIEDNLKKKISDILFSVKLDGEDGYFYVLLEHQSTVDHFMVQRLFNYMNGIWQRYKIENSAAKHLPLIYPIIFYNGNKRYTAPKSFFELFRLPEQAKQFLCEPVSVINVNEIDDEEFQKYPNAGIIEFFLKKHRERDMLKLLKEMQGIWDRLESVSISQKESLISIILWYNIEKINDEKAKDMIMDYVNKSLNLTGEEMVKGIAAQWKQEGFNRGMDIAAQWKKDALQEGIREGISKGIQEGVQKGVELTAVKMLQAGATLEFVKQVTGLTELNITKLKANI